MNFLAALLSSSGFLLFGSMNTLFTKLQFSMFSVGLDGEEKKFGKPWFGSYRMFAAMLLVLVGYCLFNLVVGLTAKRSSSKKGGFFGPNFSLKTFMFISVPAWFDLTASTCSFIALLNIKASTWQMMRGSMVVFSAALSVIFLKRKMQSHNYVGVALCVVGLLCVGGSAMLGTSEASASTAEAPLSLQIFSMALVVFGQLIQAGQVVVEEKILKGSGGGGSAVLLPPAVVVGCEGLWGFLILTLVGFPVLYMLPGSDFGGCQENIFDTMTMLGNNFALQGVVVSYMTTCSLYNLCGMTITQHLNAVHRTMLDAWRTMVIWGCGLAYYYLVDKNSAFGERWTPYSWLQLAGFMLLIVGQMTYGGLLGLPKFLKKKAVMHVAENYASPCGTMNLLSPLPVKEGFRGDGSPCPSGLKQELLLNISVTGEE